MRVLVCGGRNYSDTSSVFYALDNLQPLPTVIINGGASGADEISRLYAHKRGISLETYNADWGKHGKAAGPIRNSEMLKNGKPDLVLAFHGGRGTEDMIRQAEKSGVKVKRVN